ncbi:substrate-binding domain-containing protein [Paenibacillus physcomitrellae]|uniref:LacI family transcriptional regulator n=1 Tax=Paenibacillus physcomitrellae TaxID=1619311 RepID=A0ABQ1FNQ3_9BACL|nr:substrate-binding domain-containing protein [Paenibacillus physcomitrellae]GGA23764.1 LacI family transcriptional regulator [Paenibacillus physcomitrellae]
MSLHKNILLTAAACLLLVTAGCSSANRELGEEGRKPVIDLIVKMDHGDYWNTVRMGAEVAAKEYNVNFKFSAPENENDIAGQIRLMEQSIKEKPDAIILSATDYMALAQVTDRASYAGIPVIAMDSEVASTKVKSYIGANNYEAGQKAAERLIQLTGTSAEIGIVNFVQGARNADQREEGFTDYAARFSGVHIVDTVYCGSDEALAYQLTKEMLKKFPDLDGIVAMNAEASIGVGKALAESGLDRSLKLITFDNPPEMLELLQEKKVQAMVVQNPFSNGYLAVVSALKAARGENVDERYDTGTKVIDLENMLWPENQKLLFPFVK